MFSEIEIQ